MNIGLDIGYSAVKAVSGDRRVTFPSVVGTPETARFSLNGGKNIILTTPHHVQIGDGAVQQSRFLNRREDRQWVESDAWYSLFLAAISELTSASRVELNLVTGLPVAFYDDKALISSQLLGNHRVQREGRPAQRLEVSGCHVIPQPFGALLAATLGDNGRIVDHHLATGEVGIVDVGGKTTNILSVNALSEITDGTSSVNSGSWDAVRAVRDYLSTHYPGLEELRGHRIIQAITDRRVSYFDEEADLSPIIDETLDPLADQVLAEITRRWGNAATLQAIIVSGGGALLIGPRIQNRFRHARVIENPVFANALGFWRFAQRLATS